jgi:hypothetical protein
MPEIRPESELEDRRSENPLALTALRLKSECYYPYMKSATDRVYPIRSGVRATVHCCPFSAIQLRVSVGRLAELGELTGGCRTPDAPGVSRINRERLGWVNLR